MKQFYQYTWYSGKSRFAFTRYNRFLIHIWKNGTHFRQNSQVRRTKNIFGEKMQKKLVVSKVFRKKCSFGELEIESGDSKFTDSIESRLARNRQDCNRLEIAGLQLKFVATIFHWHYEIKLSPTLATCNLSLWWKGNIEGEKKKLEFLQNTKVV